MRKTIGWIFTAVGTLGLLPALCGIMILGTAAARIYAAYPRGNRDEVFWYTFVVLMLIFGLVLWTGNVRYSLCGKSWWGTRIFWRVSGFYNAVFALAVATFVVFADAPLLLAGVPYPLVASALSFKMAKGERDGL